MKGTSKRIIFKRKIGCYVKMTAYFSFVTIMYYQYLLFQYYFSRYI